MPIGWPSARGRRRLGAPSVRGRLLKPTPTTRALEQYDWNPAFELVLDEARRSIDRQMDSVREARERAGKLLGYASVVAAALGFTTTNGALGIVGWIAVVGS